MPPIPSRFTKISTLLVDPTTLRPLALVASQSPLKQLPLETKDYAGRSNSYLTDIRNICFPVWPIFGNMRSFLKAFRSENPDTFIHDLVKRYGRPGIYKTYLFGSPSITISIPETCVLDESRDKSQMNDPNEKRGMVDLPIEVEDEDGQKWQDED
ncbi:hypothetical protein QUC31_006654 [Theobroma cacao]